MRSAILWSDVTIVKRSWNQEERVRMHFYLELYAYCDIICLQLSPKWNFQKKSGTNLDSEQM